MATSGNSNCSAADTIELRNYVLADTTFLRDTICQGYDYTEYGFSMSAEFLNQMFTLHPGWPESWFTGLQRIEDRHGCDSVILLNLVVERHWQQEQTVFACEQYVWAGDTLTESGDYVKDLVY